MEGLNSVQQHYSVEDLSVKLDALLADAGFGETPVGWQTLAPVDQFHLRGLEATEELAADLNLTEAESFLDVGCGFGGPARYLAGRYGCHVTGVDLTPAYVEVARKLAAKVGLQDLLTFVQGDATNLPFPDDTFDAAWLMHVGMNIENKPALYASIFRVLKPGSRLVVYDILRRGEEPVHYPAPWSKSAHSSFLATRGEMLDYFSNAGFSEIQPTERTQEVVAWMEGMRAAQAARGAELSLAPEGPGSFNLVSLVLGEEGPQISVNMARNLNEGRIAVFKFLATKE